jgi:hypothetical protein
LKIRAGDLSDVFEMIRANELGEDFADMLELDVSQNFLEIQRKLERSD